MCIRDRVYAAVMLGTVILFWLAALPALCGATLRIFFALAVTLVGGRCLLYTSRCV